MSQIDYTTEEIAEKIHALGDKIYGDALGCARRAGTDILGLVCIANTAMGRPGDSPMSFAEVYELAAQLMYQTD